MCVGVCVRACAYAYVCVSVYVHVFVYLSLSLSLSVYLRMFVCVVSSISTETNDERTHLFYTTNIYFST